MPDAYLYHMKHTILLVIGLGLMFSGTTGVVRAQGSLTPPATVGPGMKTLAQLEPRTPISSPSYTISTSGSYYLTTNLVVPGGNNGILITASNVRLDLNGFGILAAGTSAGGYGIYLNGNQTNICIANGHIFSAITNNGATLYNRPGFTGGISSGGAVNVVVERIHVYGASFYGITLGVGNMSVIRDCQVDGIGGSGMVADLVLRSSANSGGYSGLNAIQCGTAADCHAVCYGGTALAASQLAVNCLASATTGMGLSAVVVANSQGLSGSSYGVSASVGAGTVGASTSGYGAIFWVGRNCYGTTSTGTYGLYANYLLTGSTGIGGASAAIGSAHSLVTCYGSTVSAANKYNMP